MKKYAFEYSKGIKLNFIVLFFSLLFTQLKIIESFLTYRDIMLWFVLFNLLINSVYYLLFLKKKKYNILIKNTFNFIEISIISFIVFILLIRFKLANPIFGYIYIYILFPYAVILSTINEELFILIKQKEVNTLKKFLKKNIFYITSLIVIYLIIFYTK